MYPSVNLSQIYFASAVILFFYNFLWPQAGPLNPLPEVFTLCGEGGGIRTRVSLASGAATLPMSYSRSLSLYYSRLPILFFIAI
jgi:hypothetical protein